MVPTFDAKEVVLGGLLLKAGEVAFRLGIEMATDVLKEKVESYAEHKLQDRHTHPKRDGSVFSRPGLTLLSDYLAGSAPVCTEQHAAPRKRDADGNRLTLLDLNSRGAPPQACCA